MSGIRKGAISFVKTVDYFALTVNGKNFLEQENIQIYIREQD